MKRNSGSLLGRFLLLVLGSLGATGHMACSSEPNVVVDCPPMGDVTTFCQCSASDAEGSLGRDTTCDAEVVSGTCCATVGWPGLRPDGSGGHCQCSKSGRQCTRSTSQGSVELTETVSSCNGAGEAPEPGGACPTSSYVSCREDADCRCTGLCSRLSSSSTDKYCTIPCTDDSDCKDSSSWRGTKQSIRCNDALGVCLPGSD